MTKLQPGISKQTDVTHNVQSLVSNYVGLKVRAEHDDLLMCLAFILQGEKYCYLRLLFLLTTHVVTIHD